MDITTSIGIVGATIILIGFTLNQFGKISVDSKSYDLINVVGPLFLIWYAYLLESYPFLILNIVWASASLWSLLIPQKTK
jgi:hypothetical protein